jgi:hypothetical protein
MLLDEAAEHRRELQAVRVGSHCSLDDCPALAKSFIVKGAEDEKLTLMAMTTSNSHELATAVLVPTGAILEKTQALKAVNARVSNESLILTTDDQPKNRQSYWQLLGKLIGQATDTKHLIDRPNEGWCKFSGYYAEAMRRLVDAFLVYDKDHVTEIKGKLTTRGGYPSKAQIQIVNESGLKEMRTWKDDDFVDDATVERMLASRVLYETFDVRKLRRPRGCIGPELDRENAGDLQPPQGVKTVRELLVELRDDHTGKGPLGDDWGVTRADGAKPEYLWLGTREASTAALSRIIENLDVYVLPDKVAEKTSRYTFGPAIDSRGDLVLRSLEQSTGTESKFSQLEIALSHRYLADKAEAIFLDKATSDNTVARRKHLGEPDTGTTNMRPSRRNDQLCRVLGLRAPHGSWLCDLPDDTGELFLFEYYKQHFMTSSDRESMSLQLVDEVGIAVHESAASSAPTLGDTASVEPAIASEEQFEISPEFVSFHFEKPPEMTWAEKQVAGRQETAQRVSEWEGMPEQRQIEIFAAGGLDYLTCSEAKRQKILKYKPIDASKYCIYDGPCYHDNPNLSINPASGRKRMPRCHRRDCEKEQAQLIFDHRFGTKRKRQRDGSRK